MIMKKQYIKPSTTVYELKSQSQLLAGSGYPNDWDGPVGYAPSQPMDDMNKLA